MDSSERKMVVPPMVHTFPKIEEIRGTQVLLISNEKGDKFQIEFNKLVEQLGKLIKPKEEDKEIVVKVTIEDVFNAFKEQSTVHFFKPINILNNKEVEKNDKCIGAFYFDGERARLCTKDGWKTLKFE